MKCNVVRELLPIYRDRLTSEETNADIREHLSGCEECRRFYESLSEDAPREEAGEEDAWKLLGELKAKIRRNRIIAAVTACILLAGLLITAKTCWIPLPFHADRMSVETFQGVFLPGENGDGEVLWDVDFLDLEETENVLSGKYDIVESAKLCYQGMNHAASMSESRTLVRDGQEINLVYYCYYMTLWDSVVHGVFAPYSESGSSNAITRRQEHIREDVPRMTEIYYLPVRNLSGRLKDLSDEDFEAFRGEAVLVWSGVIAG